MKGLIRVSKLLKSANIFQEEMKINIDGIIEEEEEEEMLEGCGITNDAKHLHEFIWHPSRKF